MPNPVYTAHVPDTRTGVLAWRVGVTDGGTERPLRRRGRDPGLSRRVPDARGSNLFSRRSERDRDLRLRTTSDTGGSLQGRCDINRRRGVCPLRNIIYFRFPARIPTPRAVHLIQGRTPKLTPRWAVGQKTRLHFKTRSLTSPQYISHHLFRGFSCAPSSALRPLHFPQFMTCD